MTKITLEISEIPTSEIYKEQGNWGVKLNPGEKIAWQCPMLGDGGSSTENHDPLGWLLASYDNQLAGGSEDEGPDEFVFIDGDGGYYVEVTYIPD